MDYVYGGFEKPTKANKYKRKRRSRDLPEYKLPKTASNLALTIESNLSRAILDSVSSIDVTISGGYVMYDYRGRVYMKGERVKRDYGKGIYGVINRLMGVYTESIEVVAESHLVNGQVGETIFNPKSRGGFDDDGFFRTHYDYIIQYDSISKNSWTKISENIPFYNKELYKEIIELEREYLPFLNKGVCQD